MRVHASVLAPAFAAGFCAAISMVLAADGKLGTGLVVVAVLCLINGAWVLLNVLGDK